MQDASAALFFNPQYAKAYATRAAAHVELERCVRTLHLRRWHLSAALSRPPSLVALSNNMLTVRWCCAISFTEAEKDYMKAIELEPWEREHGRQLAQVKQQLTREGEKKDKKETLLS